MERWRDSMANSPENNRSGDIETTAMKREVLLMQEITASELDDSTVKQTGTNLACLRENPSLAVQHRAELPVSTTNQGELRSLRALPVCASKLARVNAGTANWSGRT
jgi:hypothetical protein